jgi:BASS family bile acid:Na+ symporter
VRRPALLPFIWIVGPEGAIKAAHPPEFSAMNWLRLPAAALALAGRHGTLVAAASIFIGLFAPPLSKAFKPYLGETIIVMLTLAFLRVNPRELWAHWTRPGLIAAATLWVMLVVPLALGAAFVLFGLDHLAPGLFFMLVLQLSAPGLMSSPALAAVLGLDVSLTLASLIVSTAITPLTASLFTHIYLGTALASPVALGLRLLAIIVGCALCATLVRRIAGDGFIETQRERIDGLSMIVMSAFAIAAMDGVVDHFRADPLLAVELTALAFALALAMIALTALVFLRAGPARALAIGLIAGNRNLGLMLAATGFMIPDLAWLYFALAQFPIYLLPHLLKPLARHVSSK